MILMGESEGMRSLGRPNRTREDSNKVDPKETGWEGVYWISPAQDKCRYMVFVKAVRSIPDESGI
jgi:hypothetical protein